jgi:osmoprotectant transport system permease protein
VTAGEPLIRWDWVLSHLPDIGERLVEHLVLTALAVGVGLVLSLVLGIWITRHRQFETPVTWLTGVLYTIPSLALFALLVPFTGLTLLTAVIGLVSYTLSILTRNVAVGIQSVPAEAREAAAGMGYTPGQILWRVELPLATVAILAGVRIAAVTTVGLTTVTALIGQGGLGYFILEGMMRFYSTPLLVGATLSVALAISIDGVLILLQRWLTPWAREGR